METKKLLNSFLVLSQEEKHLKTLSWWVNSVTSKPPCWKGIRHVNVGRPSTLLERIERLAVIHQVVRSQDVCHSVWVRSCCGSFFWQLFRSVAFYTSRDKKILLRGRGHGTYKREWFYAICEDIFISAKFLLYKILDCFESLNLRKSFLFFMRKIWNKP